MLKILSIGNSFSCDAQAWVPQLFEAAGEQVLLGNLFIGGCSLERHLNNARTSVPDYTYFRNNASMGLCRLDTGLLDENWDYITFQQASHFSGLWETYEPYLVPLTDYVREKCPKAEFLIHQTWAYETDSTHNGFIHYENDQMVMYRMLKECYEKAAQCLDVRIIPCGDAMQLARKSPLFNHAEGGESLNRDGFHLSYMTGRFLAGLVWYEFFTGRSAVDNPFIPCLYEYTGMQKGKPLRVPMLSTRPNMDQVAVLRQAAHDAVQG